MNSPLTAECTTRCGSGTKQGQTIQDPLIIRTLSGCSTKTGALRTESSYKHLKWSPLLVARPTRCTWGLVMASNRPNSLCSGGRRRHCWHFSKLYEFFCHLLKKYYLACESQFGMCVHLILYAERSEAHLEGEPACFNFFNVVIHIRRWHYLECIYPILPFNLIFISKASSLI